VSVPQTATVVEGAWVDHDEPVHVFWLRFNRSLYRDTVGLPNEALLIRRLDVLLDFEVRESPLFWLSLARLTELALKLAGDYADSCDFQAAGDLLVNPRQIDVFVKGHADPIRKQRHAGLSEQFADVIADADPAVWLRQHTVLHLRTSALLPQLFQMLAESGVMASDYVASIEKRMCRIADAITFLNAWGISNYTAMRHRWTVADAGDRELIMGHLCRFTLHRFAEMGDDIERWPRYGKRRSRFLRSSKHDSMPPPASNRTAYPHCCVPRS
jgi:hypothetical protein